MISRRTAKSLAELVVVNFRKYHYLRNSGNGYFTVDIDKIYDFLFENAYPAWLCNAIKKTWTSTETRQLKEFVMKLHTGESQLDATQNWSWEQREKLGQSYLKELSEDMLNYYSANPPSGYSSESLVSMIQFLRENLELDGHIYKDHRLLYSESDVLETTEEMGILQSLYVSLELGGKDTAFHHLKLSEEHYLEHRWDDSISNSRKFLECVLREIAVLFSQKVKNVSLPESVYSRPLQIREYLSKEGLLEVKEKEAVASVYGLLSETGSHPYMAQNEQARLLRHLSLTFSQFVMLRLQGHLSQKN